MTSKELEGLAALARDLEARLPGQELDFSVVTVGKVTATKIIPALEVTFSLPETAAKKGKKG